MCKDKIYVITFNNHYQTTKDILHSNHSCIVIYKLKTNEKEGQKREEKKGDRGRGRERKKDKDKKKRTRRVFS